jgi:phosphoribosylaminoimidazolecarboxamide formyltransferase/IMP cyclohydrolase
MASKSIKSALISVFHKDKLEPIIRLLAENDVKLISTGGTQKFIQELGVEVTPVEDLTGYPSVFGGRVKTLHPKVFGGILYRRDNENDNSEAEEFDIGAIDLVIVDLYPFEETVASGAAHADIIEKIDVGGISLIRGAAKNYKDVLTVSSRNQYEETLQILSENGCSTSLEERRRFATYAFEVSSHYDTAIFNYFNIEEGLSGFKQSYSDSIPLRYGENPHQNGAFYGDFNDMFEQLHGKAISYNNLIDIDAAVSLISDFEGEVAFAILKHNNACGLATGKDVKEAYLKAFAADTLSAFGGVLITNQKVTVDAAEEIHKLFCEVLIAPEYDADALEILKGKKNRILIIQKKKFERDTQFRALLNGVIVQDQDKKSETRDDLTVATDRQPEETETSAMIFANKIVKHTKSNAIVLAKEGQMMASGVGQTSRVDAVNHAIAKAKHFGFDLNEAVLASDAFFPFADSVELANKEGIKAIIQPGGSVKDQDSIDYCNSNGMTMVFTGIRHFKH